MHYETHLSDPNYKPIKGGFRKLGSFNPPCLCPEHNPPQHICLDPGTYEYTCPSCGNAVIVTVPFISN